MFFLWRNVSPRRRSLVTGSWRLKAGLGGVVAGDWGLVTWAAPVWGGLGAGALLLVQAPRHVLVDLPRDLDAFLRRNGLAHLLWYLLLDINGVLGADGPGELPAFLPWNIDWNIRAFLLRNIFTLGPRHLLLYFLWDLFTFLFGNLIWYLYLIYFYIISCILTKNTILSTFSQDWW